MKDIRRRLSVGLAIFAAAIRMNVVTSVTHVPLPALYCFSTWGTALLSIQRAPFSGLSGAVSATV